MPLKQVEKQRQPGYQTAVLGKMALLCRTQVITAKQRLDRRVPRVEDNLRVLIEMQQARTMLL